MAIEQIMGQLEFDFAKQIDEQNRKDFDRKATYAMFAGIALAPLLAYAMRDILPKCAMEIGQFLYKGMQ